MDADFQEFYRLDLAGEIARDYRRTCGLIGFLPGTSRLADAERGGPGFSHEASMLTRIEHSLALWLHAHTEDGKKSRNPPELLVPPHIKALAEAVELEKLPPEERKMREGSFTPEELRAYIYGSTDKNYFN